MHFNEAEKKLEEYRAKKKREALINHYKTEAKSMLNKYLKREPKIEESESQRETTQSLLLDDPSTADINFDSDANPNDDYSAYPEEPLPLTVFDYIQYFLWFVLWATLYGIFIKLQFGTVYFILSGLIGIYLNTRTRPKMKDEISAYSVFNKNCESIDGTLDAEKLTREVVFGGFR